MKYVVMVILFNIIIPVALNAETKYVSGVTQITLRTGPGTANKIIRMMKSGQSMSVIRSENGWSEVRLSNGQTGWVLNHLVRSDKPKILLFDNLEKKCDRVTKLLSRVQDENSKLIVEKQQLNDEYQEKIKNFDKVNQLYNSLRKKSANLLALESQFQETDDLLKKLTVTNKVLEEKLAEKNIQWFLYGAGVILIGFLIGRSTKRKSSRSIFS